MRNFILCYINGERHQIDAKNAFMTVAEYLRYIKGLTGTKIVCSEGDCGACTILLSRMIDGKMTSYKSINSCISFMYLLDRCHIVTVEGLKVKGHLHEVQEKMVEHHGAQCGYCTPGFICAMANMAEDLKINQKQNSEQKIKNYLTGNLCRCTGYEPIIKAGLGIELEKVELLSSVYSDGKMATDFLDNAMNSVLIKKAETSVFLPNQMREVVDFKTKNPESKLVSGATDIGVLNNKGRLELVNILSLNNVNEAYKVLEFDDRFEIGAKVSLDSVEKALKKSFPEFSRKLHIFASPQIKNKGTLVGNLVNASPIGDTIPFLILAGVEVELVSSSKVRTLPISKFIKKGYKNLDIKENEFISKIILPKTKDEFKLYKVSTRKDLDISTVTMACRYHLKGTKIEHLEVAFGGVGPSVLKMRKIEKLAKDKNFNQVLFKDLAEKVEDEISPMSDHRGSVQFRHILCKNLMLKFCDDVMVENGMDFKRSSI
jgi:xanthine dehydrogenase small subunit